MFKPRLRKSLVEAAEAVRSVFDYFANFPDPVSNVPIVKDDVIEDDSPWYLIDLTSKDDLGRCALQRIQELCRAYGFSVALDVLSIQALFKYALAPYASVVGDEASLEDLKESHAVVKADLAKSFAVSEEGLAHAERRI